MSVVESLLLSGKQNQKTLSSIEKSLKLSEKRERKESVSAAMQSRKEAQDKKRIAADRKASGSEMGKVVSLLEEIKGCVCDCEGKGGEGKGKGKGGNGGLMVALAALAPILGGALALKGLADAIKMAREGLTDWVKGLSEKTGEWFKGLELEKLPDKIKKGVEDAFENSGLKEIGAQLQTGTENLVNISQKLWDKTKEVAGNAGQSFMGLLQNGADKTKEVAGNAGQSFMGLLQNGTDKIRQLGTPMEESTGFTSDAPSTWLEQSPALKGLFSGINKLGAGLAALGGAAWSAINLENAGMPALGFQNGGPITVPGSGSGDKVPMMLQPGSFVLNRNASNFLRRQTGGAVPTMLEPGELVYLNENIKRFQTGGEVPGKFEYPLPKGNTGTGPRQIFGADRDGGARKHAGVDLVESAPWGGNPQIPVVAPKDGVVAQEKYTKSGYVAGLILNQNDGYDTRFVHMTPEVDPGTKVNAGDRIGKLIDLQDQSHLHFELYKSGDTSAMDPAPYLKSAGKTPGAGSKIPGMEKSPDGNKGEETGNTNPKFSMEGLISGAVGALGTIFGSGLANLIASTGIMDKSGFKMSDLTSSGVLKGADLGVIGSILSGLGGKDGGKDGGGGNDSGTTSSVGATVSEEKLAKNLIKDMGVTKDQAAGIVGNLSYESAGLKPNIKEGMSYGNSWEKGRTAVPAGYGWAQWSFDRHDKFVEKHLGGFGGEGGGSKKVATADDNYKYLLEELRGVEPLSGRSDGRPDMPTTGIEATTDWFRKHWERAGVPADGPRRDKAKATVQKLQTGGMVSTMLEPGESVFGPGQWDSSISKLNSAVPRFQSGGKVSATANDSIDIRWIA